MPSLLDSGKIIGREVGIKQVAQQCNLPFPLSLRALIAAPACPFTRCNRLHIKILTNPNIPIQTMLNRMREVYSTAGIQVVVASWENLSEAVLGGPIFTALNDIDAGQCEGTTTTAEQNQLFWNQNNVIPGQRNNEIVVYFVRTVLVNMMTENGCSTFPDGQPGAVVARMASRWTLAHEVGHVLGLDHITYEHQNCPAGIPRCCSMPDRTRLMTDCSTNAITGTPIVVQSEIDTMMNSNLTRQC